MLTVTMLMCLRKGLAETRVINGVLIYAIVGFIAAQIALFTQCRPFSDYWVVPAPSSKHPAAASDEADDSPTSAHRISPSRSSEMVRDLAV